MHWLYQVQWGDNDILWLLKMACILLHTTYILSNIYNSAKFPDQSKTLANNWQNYISSSVKVKRWRRMKDGGKPSLKLTLAIHACILLCIRLSSPHVKGETPSLINVNMGFLKWHGGSNERKKDVPTSAQSYQDVQWSSGSIHAFYCHSVFLIIFKIITFVGCPKTVQRWLKAMDWFCRVWISSTDSEASSLSQVNK